MADKIKVTALHQSYKRLSEIIGVDAMLKVYNEYRGTQFQYPMRLYDREAVSKLICKEYDGSNLRELSQRYGYSQRWMKAQLNKNNVK
ncbi:Mor transcription activator family protein [Loigolactobacillus binensis]|uniref:Mor transcription activator family protein n=1 Tax=Loigolactobacillus binensis TaxID=2559922 RepID=A0ABW3EAL9_9LACO|nr:Mor transcription activator family protein [Loigolactobacillus binensis]